MSLLKALQYIDMEFDNIYVPTLHHRLKVKNTAMELAFNYGYASSNEPYYIRLEWFPPQDRYCIIMEVNGSDEFIYNSWNLADTSIHNWNEDLVINFDIERSFFDCLPMVYPMTSNFKFKHLKILKSISEKYSIKKKIHNIK